MFQWDVRALEILDTLERAGHQAVLVGGCVRDALLGREPHDYDAAVSAPPEEILAACRSKFKCIPTGLAHGTVTVVHGGLPVEVTAFRKEGTYSDHRHPDRVAYTSRLEEDLARRDFTVNAMAWSRSGLADPFGGQADLAAGVIRCVGEPDRRFQEDALRVLRGLRLAAQLDFRLEGETAAAIRRNTPLLSYVAWERIQAEFLRLLCCPGAERILLDFPETVCQIVPELTPAVGFDQKNPHHCYDVYTHSVKALGRVRPEPALRLAALLHDVGKPACFSLDDQGVGHFYGHEGESARLAEQAVARLRRENVPVRLTLVGDGRLRGALKRQCRRLGISDIVDMPGFLPHDRVQALMRSHDIFLMPSVQTENGDRDGIPNVIMEALSSRMPVVATDVCGIGEVIHDGETGLLVPQRDPRALAEGVRRLLADREAALRMAGHGRDLVLHMFDSEANTRQLLHLYRDSCAHAGRESAPNA